MDTGTTEIYTYGHPRALHDARPIAPVSDPPQEVLYVRDEDDGRLFTATALPRCGDDGEYVARHGHGYSRFQHAEHGIELDLLQYVPVDDGLKISRLRLRNRSGRARRLSVTAFARSEEHPSELQSLMRISYAVFCLK